MKKLFTLLLIFATQANNFAQNNWAFYDTSNCPMNNQYFATVNAKANDIWISSLGEIMRINNGEWMVYNQGNAPFEFGMYEKVFIDSQGANFVTCNENNIVSFDGVQWTAYPLSAPNAPANSGKMVMDEEAVFWLLYGSYGLASYDGDTTIIDYSAQITSHFIDIDYDNTDGSIWAAAYQDGVYNYKDGVWTAYNEDNSDLQFLKIKDIEFDREGKLWVATDEGIGRFDSQEWDFYPIGGGEINWLAFDTDNTAWVIYDGRKKLGYVDGSQIIYIDSSLEALDPFAYGLSIDDNNNKYITKDEDGMYIYNENGLSISEQIPGNIGCKIYPNPAKDHISINFKGLEVATYELSLYNMLGSLQYKKKHSSKTVQLTDLANGAYFYKIKVGKGSFCGKLIIAQ